MTRSGTAPKSVRYEQAKATVHDIIHAARRNEVGFGDRGLSVRARPSKYTNLKVFDIRIGEELIMGGCGIQHAQAFLIGWVLSRRIGE